MNKEHSTETDHSAEPNSATVPRAFARIKAGRVQLGGADEPEDEGKRPVNSGRVSLRSRAQHSRPVGSSESPKEK